LSVLILLGSSAIARVVAPVSNTSLTRFDAIIVLGYKSDDDGNPTPTQQARVNEAVREYERGVAPRLIISGAAVHSPFVEAKVMARMAEAQGIPASAIYVEPEARNTIQNVCYSERIMKAHGWRSAEVISGASHLPRAGLILSSSSLEWRTHAAPPVAEQMGLYPFAASAYELFSTARYLVWGHWTQGCEL
jgi:uncharacterized SAM-binding protein YcdF (DUF218 family)